MEALGSILNPITYRKICTLGKNEYLTEEYFASDYFDYIMIDEFHHAVTNQYWRIVEYFIPHFLLGMTATPERMGGKNIYEICDYNVPYEISLKDAINNIADLLYHLFLLWSRQAYGA